MKSFRTKSLGQFFSFAGVGVAGLLTDVAVFLVSLKYFGWAIPWARTLSVTCSITATWALNRRYTFPGTTGSLHWEYARYAAVQTVGLTINVGIFTLCLSMFGWARHHPLAALAAGSAAASAFNFFGARSFAYLRTTISQ